VSFVSLTAIRSSLRAGILFVFVAPFVFLVSGTAAISSRLSGRIVFTVSANSRGDLYTVDATGLRRRQLTNDRPWELYPVWSPDGRSIAYVKDWLYRIPATGGPPRLLLGKSSSARAGITGIQDLSWSPDGRHFAFTATTKFFSTLQVWTFALGGTLKRVTQDGSDPSWSPGGKRIAYTGRTGIIMIGANGRGARRVPGTTPADSSPIWSPNGKWIAVSRAHTDRRKHQVVSIDLLSAVRRQRIRIVTGRFIFPAAWSPSGDAVLYLWKADPLPASASQLFIVGRSGGHPRPVFGTDGAVGPASWHR